MVKVVWTKRSLTDLDDIAEYIAKDSPKYAKITLEKIIKEVVRIEQNAYIGRIVPETKIKNIRELIKGNYRIIYNINVAKVEILTVHHSARDLNKRGFLPID